MSDYRDGQLEKLKDKQKLIDRIRESMQDDGELNDWEVGFLGSVYEQLLGGREGLSDAQMDKLERIEYVRAEGRQAYWDEYGHGN